MSSAPICYLTSCKAWDVDLQCPEDHLWPSKILGINVKATFIASQKTEREDEEGKKSGMARIIVQQESHKLRLEQLLNDVVTKDWNDTNIYDVLDSMQIPIGRSTVDEIVGCALGMVAKESYKNRKVLRMRVEIEVLVDEQPNLAEGDAYCIDAEADDFWETAEAFRKLRKVVVEEPVENLCSICLVGFLEGSEISATPCSHVFHDRCIRAWLKKCSKKFCPNCVTILA
ncbi:hypothetical protein ERO13_D11G273300v2 [Gossypium hirsutum]|uniref:RING-type domain-containing protein n=2 Tax=Gossypium TaxID=3633 RepID=A0A1U8MY30_GOSHI|nr:uncharacterized protein LOC107941393 [Gossypium hirsutum]KAG4122546.1 hypothetical protein ERO13_D11G273300v2 [Gossypium hirsutum]